MKDLLRIKKKVLPTIVGEFLLRCELVAWKTKWKNSPSLEPKYRDRIHEGKDKRPGGQTQGDLT